MNEAIAIQREHDVGRPAEHFRLRRGGCRLESRRRRRSGGGRRNARRQRQDDRDLQHRVADHGPAPAEVGDGALEDGRPDEAGEIAAARNQRQRRAAPPVEPVADIDVERRVEPGVAEQAHEQAVADIELPRRAAGRDEQPDADHHRAEHHRPADAEALGDAAHQDAADRGAEPGERAGERRHRARAAHFLGDRLQSDRGDPRPAERQAEQGERNRPRRPKRSASRWSACRCLAWSIRYPAVRWRAIWRGRAKLVLCSQREGGSEMRKSLIAIALAAICAIGGRCRGANLSFAADHHHRAVRGRRPVRRAGAGAWASACAPR